MKGHVILSHGLQSGPDATKVNALAVEAQILGWSAELMDYRDLDLVGELGDIQGRIDRLQVVAQRVRVPLVLAGSSMGAFVSARVSLAVPCAGLFLMVPPIQLETFAEPLEAAKVPTQIVHAWHDELIPVAGVVAWAQARSDELMLVNDSHRLSDHVDYCAKAFARFLKAL